MLSIVQDSSILGGMYENILIFHFMVQDAQKIKREIIQAEEENVCDDPLVPEV